MPLVLQPSFSISKNLYAIDRASFQVSPTSPTSNGYAMWRYDLSAMWFRRKGGKTQAMIGNLWGFSTEDPKDWRNQIQRKWTLDEFLEGYRTASYGGTPLGRWNGEAPWWGGELAKDYARQQLVLPQLQQAWEHYPEIPLAHEGWYLAS